MSKGFSYKEMLTNQLIVFINQRISTSEDMKGKVASLTEEKKKNFQQKIVESIIAKAKSLADIQGTNYLGMMGDSGEQEMLSWVDTFFDDFEENMKEPEKPKTQVKMPSSTVAKISNEKGSYPTEEGFFGIEVKLDKKNFLSQEDFIKKIKEENKGKEVTFEWLEGEIKFEIKEKAKKEKPKKEKPIIPDKIELDGPLTEEDILGGEVFEDEDEEKEEVEANKETEKRRKESEKDLDDEDEDEDDEDEDEDEDEDDEDEDEDDEEEEDDLL